MSSASWFHYGLLFRNTVIRQTSPQTLLKHLMTFADVLQRPEEYCLENITCPLWDLVLTDQAGSWKVNCRGQALLHQLPPGEIGSNVSNLIFGNESVSVDSEGRSGFSFRRTFHNHILLRINGLSHIYYIALHMLPTTWHLIRDMNQTYSQCNELKI